MRLTRLIAMLLAVEILFLGGSAYYQLVFPVRVLHHIVITLVLAVWLLLRLKNRQGLPQTPLNIPLFAACGVWVLSAVISDDPRMTFENLWFPFTHLIFFWIFADFIQRRQERLLFEVQFIAGALVLMLSALELASWYFGLGIIPGTSIGWAGMTGLPYVAPRLALALNISTLLAGYVAPLVIVTAGWALTDDPALRDQLNAGAVPARSVPQEFAGVLYGRPANFDLPVTMRPPGPGHQAMLPWYEIAEISIAQGDVEQARRVYQAIIEYAPDETEAADRLAALGR